MFCEQGLRLSLRFCFINKGSPYSITKRRVPELIPILGSQPAGDVSHKPGGRLPLLSARPAVTPATLKRAFTNFAAWWTEAQWVWTVCLRLLPDSVAAAIWTQAFLRLSPASEPLGYRATLCFIAKLNKTKLVATMLSSESLELMLAMRFVADVTHRVQYEPKRCRKL